MKAWPGCAPDFVLACTTLTLWVNGGMPASVSRSEPSPEGDTL